MRLFHFSDNHGEIAWLGEVDLSGIDIIVSSGDFFISHTGGGPKEKARIQAQWFERNEGFIKAAFGGKPVLVINGNHDYVCLAERLLAAGYPNAIKVPMGGVTIGGVTFAGLEEVAAFKGIWNREASWCELKALVEELFSCQADVLVTHAPPLGILDHEVGIEPLFTAFRYQEHRIRHHLFGHNHYYGGRAEEAMGVRFYNNACTCGIVEVS